MLGGAVDAQLGSAQGFGLAGGGAGARNQIGVTVQARIADGGTRTVTASDGPVNVNATDFSRIEANAGALGLFVGIGQGTSVNIALGIAVAINTIDNTVEAIIEGTIVKGDAVNVTATTVDPADATKKSTIDALAIGIAALFHLGTGDSSGLNLAAGLSVAINDIKNTVQALVRTGADVTADNGDLKIAATDASLIHVDAGGFALAIELGAGSGSAVNIAAGISIGLNRIENTVKAAIDASLAKASNAVSVSASSDSTIEALTMAGSASLGLRVGQGVGVQASAAVGFAQNTIKNTVEAAIRNATTTDATRAAAVVAGPGGISVTVTDTASITSKFGSGSLAVGIGLSDGGSAQIGLSAAVALATNTVDNKVDAIVTGSSLSSGGGVTVSATSNRNLFAEGGSVSVNVQIQISQTPISIALSAVVVIVENVVKGYTKAGIHDSSVSAAGDVLVHAKDTSTLDSGIGGGSLSVALLAVDVVIVNPTNTIENVVEAYVTDSTVTSTGGDVSVKAETRSDVKRTLNGAVAVTIGIGGAGTGQKANATIGGTTEARIDATSDITAGDQVLVDATSDNTVSVKTFGGSGSLIAGSTIDAIGKITRSTRAHIDDGASITAASLAVKALAKRMNIDVDTELGNVGLVGGGGSNLAQALASGDVEAWIGRKAGTTATPKNTVIDVTGAVQITATAQETDLDADARGGSGSVIIAVTLMTGEASASGSTRAYLGELGTATGTDAAKFDAGALTIDADATNTTTNAVILPVSFAIVASGTGPTSGNMSSKATITGKAEAYAVPSLTTQAVADRVKLVLDTGALTIEAGAATKANAEGRGGAGAIGIAVAILDAQAENSFATLAYLGDGAQVDARGLDIHADTRQAEATVTVIVGAGAILGGGGRAQGTAKTNGGTDAHIGAGANVTVTDGVTAVRADANSVAAVDVLIATASILVTGRDARRRSRPRRPPSRTSERGPCSRTKKVGTGTGNTLGNPGDVLVRAISAAEGDAKSESYGGAVFVSGDAARATTTVEPVVRAWTGAGTQVTAFGAVQVIATYQQAGAPPSTKIISVDTTNDTIQINVGLTLRDGNIVSIAGATPARDYGVLVVSPGVIQLGSAFEGADVDAARDTITFAADHNLADGDVVKLDSPRLVEFDPRTMVNDTADQLTLSVAPGLRTGDPVVYRTAGGLGVGGLTSGTPYYVIVDPTNPQRIKFATNRANALAGTAIPITPAATAGAINWLEGVIEGLSTGVNYRVVRIDARTIKLRTELPVAAPPLQPFAAGQVTGNVITIPTGHGFVNNQAVTYHAPPNVAKTFGGELVDVNVLADGTVQVTIGADGIGVPTLNAAGNNIYISNHGFTNGQLVRYQAISGAPIGGLTNNTDYRVLVKGTHEIQLANLVVVVPGNVTFTRDADNGDGFTADTIRRNDGGSWTSLGFVAGQVITIDGTSVNNRTVTIASISGDTLVLTQQNVVANEIVGAVRMYMAPIALSEPRPTAATASPR